MIEGERSFTRKTLVAVARFVSFVVVMAATLSIAMGIYLMMVSYPATIIPVAILGLLAIFLLCAWFSWNE